MNALRKSAATLMLLAPLSLGSASAHDMRDLYAIGGTIGFNGQLNASADGGLKGAGAALQLDFMAGLSSQWEIGFGIGVSGSDTAVYDPAFKARELARLDTVGYIAYLAPTMTCVPLEIRVRGRLNPLGTLNPYATFGAGLALFSDNNNAYAGGYDYYGNSYSNVADHTYVRGSVSLELGLDVALSEQLSAQIGATGRGYYDNPFGSSPTVKTPPQMDLHIGITWYGGFMSHGRGRGMHGGPSDY